VIARAWRALRAWFLLEGQPSAAARPEVRAASSPQELAQRITWPAPPAEWQVEEARRALDDRKASRPTIVCLCGSTRFGATFDAASLRETLAGRIVLTVACVSRSDDQLGLSAATRAMLDALHRRKIDLADELLVVNPGGYIGASTAREIAYAQRAGKRVRYWEAA